MTSLRRQTSFTIILAAALGGTPALHAEADHTEGATFTGTFTVQFAGSQQCGPGDSACTQCVQNSGFFVEAQGIGQTSLGPLFVKVLKCYNPNVAPYGTYVGTLVLSLVAPDSPHETDSLTLDYTGQNNNAGDFYTFGPFSGRLTVKNGAGKFAGARGAAVFTAASGPSFAASAFGAQTSPFSLAGTAFYKVDGTITGVR